VSLEQHSCGYLNSPTVLKAWPWAYPNLSLFLLILASPKALSLAHFYLYSPVGQLIKSFGILQQQYADDNQLYISILPHLLTLYLVELTHTLNYITGFALKADEFEAVWFSTRQRSLSFPQSLLSTLAGSTIPISAKIKTRGSNP